MKRVLKLIPIICLFIITIIIIFQKIYLKKDLVNLFGYSLLIVNTGSMQPNIKEGDCILIKKVTDYEIGDIVTYLDEDGYYITHRVINCDNDEFITKGDFNNIADEAIDISQIKGKVIWNMSFIKLLIIILISVIIYILLL